MYDAGHGVAKDRVAAVKWYLLAAEQGEASAQTSLGFKYWQGEGVPKDYVLAYKWFNLAAALGDPNVFAPSGDLVFGATFAAGARDDLAKLMTPDQIAEAERLAREWKLKAGH